MLTDAKQLRLLREKKKGSSSGGGVAVLSEEAEVEIPAGTEAVLDRIDAAIESTMSAQELTEGATEPCGCLTL